MANKFKYSNEKNSDGTRTYTVYRNGEWNASYTSMPNESYSDFLNRINEDVKKQTEGKIEAKF